MSLQGFECEAGINDPGLGGAFPVGVGDFAVKGETRTGKRTPTPQALDDDDQLIEVGDSILSGLILADFFSSRASREESHGIVVPIVHNL